ncbi:cytochrome P450 [Anopheles sinensis]|uniref:Cytochrome P450 n=1 Tax=Anopheles sinensis TaxID=74873 RepID=A0A084VY39_ANOSI|nr:cytochrome P450 [Anopheles sinensis]
MHWPTRTKLLGWTLAGAPDARDDYDGRQANFHTPSSQPKLPASSKLLHSKGILQQSYPLEGRSFARHGDGFRMHAAPTTARRPGSVN